MKKKIEERVGERVTLKNQGLNLPATSKQKKINNVSQQIKEEQKKYRYEPV